MIFEHDKTKKENIEHGLKNELFIIMCEGDSTPNAYAIRFMRPMC